MHVLGFGTWAAFVTGWNELRRFESIVREIATIIIYALIRGSASMLADCLSETLTL